MASGSRDTTIRLWNTQAADCLNTLKGHTGTIRALATLPDGTLTSGSFDTTIRLWNTQTGECLNTLNGHTDAIWTLAILPDGTLVSGSWDKTIRLWGPEPKHGSQLPPSPLAISTKKQRKVYAVNYPDTPGTTILTHRGQLLERI